jgi:hypothetical protein
VLSFDRAEPEIVANGAVIADIVVTSNDQSGET